MTVAFTHRSALRAPAGLAAVRPAGQVSGYCSSNTYDSRGWCVDASGNVLSALGFIAGPPGSSPSNGVWSASHVSSSSTSGTSSGTSASNQQLYNTVGTLIGTTGSTISSIIQSNNQQAIAQLQSQTQIEIANLQNQAAEAQRQGNIALANQAAAQAAQLQQFNAQLDASKTQRTLIVAGAALLGVAILGTVAFFIVRGARSSGGVRRNPSRAGGRRVRRRRGSRTRR